MQPAHKLKGSFISDLKIGEAKFSAAVSRKQTKATRSGKPYLCLTLKDRTGDVDARIWDGVEQANQEIQEGCVLGIYGTVEEFNGALQLKIGQYFVLSSDAYCMADMIPASERDPEEMLQELDGWIGTIADSDIRNLVASIVVAHANDLRTAPAAKKMHHAYVAGLLEHTLSMIGAADKLCAHYIRLDRDLLIAGCILHDIGKVREQRVGMTFEYTTEGNLVGHIIIGCVLIEQHSGSCPANKKFLLQHLVASHHGQYEYGAPKLPSTPEAVALHLIDKMDASLNQLWRVIDATPEQDDWNWAAGLNRSIYAPGSRLESPVVPEAEGVPA